MKKLLTLATIAVLLMVLAGCDRTSPTTEPHRPLETPVAQTPTPTAGPTARPTPRVEVVPGIAPDSFVAVVPQTLRTGYTERVSVLLFNGDRPVSGNVRLTLLDKGASVSSVSARVHGAANIEFPVPQLQQGRYEIEVEVEDVSETRSASIDVEDGVLLFVETDKPIYKPGQTVHIRADDVRRPVKALAVCRDHRGAGRQGHQGIQEGGCDRRLRDGDGRSAAVDRAEPGRLEAHGPRGGPEDAARRARRRVRSAQV